MAELKPTTAQYYANLSADYDAKIRQLVPHYDDMVQCIVDLLMRSAPARILDLGVGVGTLAQLVLDRLPTVQVTALDASAEMLAAAQRRLAPYGERALVVHSEITDFTPAAPYDAVVSNLVLHNLRRSDKPAVLGRIARWLTPGGWFIWGDLIRHADPGLQAHYVEYRIAFARGAGCPEDLIAENFRKETEDDSPLTVPETAALAGESGLRDVHTVWAHDTFAVFVLPKPGGA